MPSPTRQSTNRRGWWIALASIWLGGVAAIGLTEFVIEDSARSERADGSAFGAERQRTPVDTNATPDRSREPPSSEPQSPAKSASVQEHSESEGSEDSRNDSSSSAGRAPSRAERQGRLREVYRRFEKQGRAPVITDRQREWAKERLEQHEVDTRDFELSCSHRLCRGEFRFEGLREARGLARIRLPYDFPVLWGRPAPTPDGSVRVVLYWGLEGTDPRRLARAAAPLPRTR